MPTYHQMGHDSKNLISCTELTGYEGAILSPVDYIPSKMVSIIRECQSDEGFETIFDPQLYFPRTGRTKLYQWPYFPTDFQTVDFSSLDWWSGLISNLEQTALEIQPTGMCSPIIKPRIFDNGFYGLMIDIGSLFFDQINPLGIDVYQTALVSINELADQQSLLTIASILTRTKATKMYLILKSEVEPRRELRDSQEIKGAMKLINILKQNNISVLVGFCSSDMILWKEAGADSCASGKFFNLRRFTPARWDAPDGGGGQLSYWFEEGLLAYLQEADFLRAQRAGIISDSSSRNPLLPQITDSVHTGTAWRGLGWRQYLWWFQDAENRLANNSTDAYSLLQTAQNNWATLSRNNIIFDEPRNRGAWISEWINAVTEYRNEI